MERDTVSEVQILDEAVYISDYANTLEKDINPTILSTDTGKIGGQTGLFTFGMATGLGEGKHWI